MACGQFWGNDDVTLLALVGLAIKLSDGLSYFRATVVVLIGPSGSIMEPNQITATFL